MLDLFHLFNSEVHKRKIVPHKHKHTYTPNSIHFKPKLKTFFLFRLLTKQKQITMFFRLFWRKQNRSSCGGKFNFVFLLDRTQRKPHNKKKKKAHIIGSLCRVDGFCACAGATNGIASEKKRARVLNRMRMHELKHRKNSTETCTRRCRLRLCNRFVCTNYKISTCIMCTISVRHLVEMARSRCYFSRLVCLCGGFMYKFG